MTENGEVTTPPGRKMLKKMEEASRGRFYALKAKINASIPRLNGHSGDIIDLDPEKPPPKETIFRKLRKLKDEPKTENGNLSNDKSTPPHSEAPGSKLRILKNELEPKMRQQWKDGLKKRCELWAKERKNIERKERRSNDHHSTEEPEENQEEEEIEEQEDDVQNVAMAENINGDNQSEIDKHFSETVMDASEIVAQSESMQDLSMNENTNHSSPKTDARLIAKSPCIPIGKVWPIFNNRTRSEEGYFTNISDCSDIFESSKRCSSPEACQTDAGNESNDNIAIARRLLAGVLNEDDTCMPTSQDIMNVCSGNFVNSDDGSDISMDNNMDAVMSTPTTKRVPEPWDLFGTPSEHQGLNTSSAPNIAVGTHESINQGSQMLPNLRIDNRKKRNRLSSNSDDSVLDDEIHGDEGLDEVDAGGYSENEGSEGDNFENDEICENGEIDEEEAYLRREKELRNYFDDEAELSGSDVGENEDEDEMNEDDYEQEQGDLDDLPSDDELRSQIGRVHWKQMMADDKRKLLKYKEAFIRNEETNELKFRFRWKRNYTEEDGDFNGGEDGVNGDDEGQEMDESDELWQESLKEKSKWLTMHGVAVEDAMADTEDMNDKGRFFNVAKLALNRNKDPITGGIDRSTHAETRDLSVSHRFINLYLGSHTKGSFLNRQSSSKRDNVAFGKVSLDIGAYARKTDVLSPTKENMVENRTEKRPLNEGSFAQNKRKIFKCDGGSIFEKFK